MGLEQIGMASVVIIMSDDEATSLLLLIHVTLLLIWLGHIWRRNGELGFEATISLYHILLLIYLNTSCFF
jgi:hypothetical protein